MNEEAIEAAVDKIADEVEMDDHFEDMANDVGLTLAEIMERVVVELKARGA